MSNPVPNASLPPFIETGEATAMIPMADSSLSPVTVIGTREIRQTFDDICVRQAAPAAPPPVSPRSCSTPTPTAATARPSAA